NINPNYAKALDNRGWVFYKKRDYARALEDFNAEIKIAPSLLAYINSVNVYAVTGELDRAAADYGMAIKLDPQDARGWRNRGLIRLFKNDYRGGIADYNEALKYDPQDVRSWNNRGQAKMRLGDKKGAIADFRKALELEPGLKSAVESLKQLGAS